MYVTAHEWLQIIGELIAVFVIVPYLLQLAARVERREDKLRLRIIAGLTILIDGILLWNHMYLRME